MRNGLNKHYNGHHHYGDFEIAINPKDIKVKGYCRVLEKQSTSGFQELPQVENPDDFVASNCVIQHDQHWCVEFVWQVFGPIACLLECGHWKPKLYFEKIGGGETHFSPEAVVEDVGIPSHEYKLKVPIKPYALEPGPYKMVCCLQYCFKNGSAGPIVGFEDKGIIKIFEDKRGKKKHVEGDNQPNEFNISAHGITTQGPMNQTLDSPFVFGRMFDLDPLYLDPRNLFKLGRSGGIMDAGMSSVQLTRTVPLGMIFLGQFIDHDITFDATSSFSRINNPNETPNFRTPNLDLDCVFGDGPEVSPFLYEKDSLKLINGVSNQNPGQDPAFTEHDLARTGQSVAIIGDPRNDENLIVSQLQLAFIRFYNAVYNDVASSPQGQNLARKEIYEKARRIVTWHYQWVVLHEFLPLLCGKRTVDKILGMGRQFYLPQNGPFIPIEFSVAAYRFGHSMIAQSFRVQQGGTIFDLFSPELGGGFSPISDHRQIVDWCVFFDFNGTSFQKAEKLDIKLASDLLNLPFVRGSANEKSLAIRNLIRSQSFQLPAGEVVAEKMGRPQEEIQAVRQYLETIVASESIDLGPGVPLWLYILAEADVIGKDANPVLSGEGLGPVGGTIVAEVLIGLMELDPESFLGSNRNWTPSLGNSSMNFSITDLLDKANAELTS